MRPWKLCSICLTSADGLLEWIAIDAETDPRPGGQLTWTHANGQVVSGRYIDVRRPRRLVFTYGWESNEAVGPGATRVEIDLERISDDSTRLRLAHYELPEAEIEAHLDGWRYFLDLLADRAGQRMNRLAIS